MMSNDTDVQYISVTLPHFVLALTLSESPMPTPFKPYIHPDYSLGPRSLVFVE